MFTLHVDYSLVKLSQLPKYDLSGPTFINLSLKENLIGFISFTSSEF